MRNDPDQAISSLHLLHKVLELSEICFAPDDWCFKKHTPNSDAYILLKEINVLSKLFLPELDDQKVGDYIKSILYGKFIHKRNVNIYKKMLMKLNNAYFKTNNNISISEMQAADILASNYMHVLIFKKYLYQWKSINPIFKEQRNNLTYSNFIINMTLKNFNQSPMDHFLSSVIDPFNLVYKKNELIVSYDYPEIGREIAGL